MSNIKMCGRKECQYESVATIGDTSLCKRCLKEFRDSMIRRAEHSTEEDILSRLVTFIEKRPGLELEAVDDLLSRLVKYRTWYSWALGVQSKK